MKTIDNLMDRLKGLHSQTKETPLFNPVFQLGLDISRSLEGGELNLDDLESLVAELECASMQARSKRLRKLVEPVDQASNSDALAGSLGTPSYAEFAAQWERPQLHTVFTAHPTFLLTPAQSEAVARGASQAGDIGAEVCITGSEREAVTLTYEHGRAMEAIANAQDARDTIVSELLAHAAEQWPNEWHGLKPLPFRFASWVGYDM
ncbi:MAG: hypothetical protein ABJG26_14715, partial [Marinomonas sp.]